MLVCKITQRKLEEMSYMRRDGDMKFLSDKEIRNGDLEGLEVETDKCVCKILNTWARQAMKY